MKQESVTLIHIAVVAIMISQVAGQCQDKPGVYKATNPSDCSKFFWCIDGEALPGKCADGEIFFEEKQDCESETERTRPSATTKFRCNIPGATTTRSLRQTTKKNVDPCANKPDDTLLPYPWDRRHYFSCFFGASFIEVCPDGKIFFEKEQKCIAESKTTVRPSRSSPRPRPVKSANSSVGPCANKPDNFFVADPSDHSRYFWCIDGHVIPGMCEDGRIFYYDGEYMHCYHKVD